LERSILQITRRIDSKASTKKSLTSRFQVKFFTTCRSAPLSNHSFSY
jgi:hypothetical protein